MTERCIVASRNIRHLKAEAARLRPVISHTSTLTVDTGGLWLRSDCIAHDLTAIRRVG